mmetsp:Transcript_66501/g.144963  ORF Transcript_66501/g.144963 Transcript_66501/m.144963 type:complete len:262 (+) Transcript_66501:184-969(+)
MSRSFACFSTLTRISVPRSWSRRKRRKVLIILPWVSREISYSVNLDEIDDTNDAKQTTPRTEQSTAERRSILLRGVTSTPPRVIIPRAQWKETIYWWNVVACDHGITSSGTMEPASQEASPSPAFPTAYQMQAMRCINQRSINRSLVTSITMLSKAPIFGRIMSARRSKCSKIRASRSSPISFSSRPTLRNLRTFIGEVERFEMSAGLRASPTLDQSQATTRRSNGNQVLRYRQRMARGPISSSPRTKIPVRKFKRMSKDQ